MSTTQLKEVGHEKILPFPAGDAPIYTLLVLCKQLIELVLERMKKGEP